jgi:hypothetical protein
LIPIFVFAYLKNRWIGHATQLIFMIVATSIAVETIYKYDIKAGIFAS